MDRPVADKLPHALTHRALPGKTVPTMKRSIPSLSSLLAFEAAARHLSFTDASREMHVTQTAISHQIRNLEELLETRLFVRRKNALALTAAGQQYLETVSHAIDMLDSATARTRREKSTEILTIHCLPTYATHCLIPALPEFQRANPGITLQVFTNQTFDQFRQRTYDVAIRYGSGNWSGLKAELLHHEEIFPVCTPALAAQILDVNTHKSLANLTQIRTYFSTTYQDDWPNWLDAAGLSNAEFAGEAIFNLQITSLQAALDGVGITLGRTPLTDSHLRQGTLIAPFETRLRTGSGYYLASPADKISRDEVQAFWGWARERLGMPANAGGKL